MRRLLGKDSKYICIPAGSLASLTFCLYRNNTIALYVMLKTLQVLFYQIIIIKYCIDRFNYLFNYILFADNVY